MRIKVNIFGEKKLISFIKKEKKNQKKELSINIIDKSQVTNMHLKSYKSYQQQVQIYQYLIQQMLKTLQLCLNYELD